MDDIFSDDDFDMGGNDDPMFGFGPDLGDAADGNGVRPTGELSDAEGGGGAGGGGELGGGDGGAEATVPVIENVQAYLPNCAPRSFPVTVTVLCQACLGTGAGPGVGVDLCQLSCAVQNVEFAPQKKVPAATLRLSEPVATVRIHSSGTLTILGCSSVAEARLAAQLSARLIRKALGLDFDSLRFRVRSLLARFNIGSPVWLAELARHSYVPGSVPGLAHVHTSYDPERMQGCMVVLRGPPGNAWKVTIIVHVNGKLTLLGARSPEEIRFAFDAFVPIVAKYLGKVPSS